MPPKSKSKSKSNGRKSKAVPKPKQIWRVKQPTRNWLELPSDLMLNILQRLGVFDRLENAQKVCTAWRQICKDPAMWRLVYIDRYSSGKDRLRCKDMSIGKNLPQLTHLELIGNSITNVGLQAILDGCCHLESLDLRRCLYIDLDGDLGKRCSQQIKYPKFPSGRDSVQGFKYTLFINDSDSDDEYLDYDDAYLDYDDEYSDYDDYTAYHNDGLSEMMAFMDNDGDLSEMMAFMDIFG
ncbi:putative F-box domain, leucine-rich repeat domain superfamily, F-box-like domain superfamily [Helianthus debilis subsp. tardiflorus]